MRWVNTWAGVLFALMPRGGVGASGGAYNSFKPMPLR